MHIILSPAKKMCIRDRGDADTVISASEQVPAKIVTINTSVGTLKAKLYDDVPNHVRTFIERAKRGEYNGTLFTRVLPEFMIQGGAPDSRNAPAGARCGFGDRNSEIMQMCIRDRYNRFRFEAYLPKFNIGKSMFESGYLTCDNPEDRVNLKLKATNYNAKGLRNYMDLKADAKDNRIQTQISWANNKERLFKADLSASTLFIEEEQEKGPAKLRTEISLNESPLILNDSTWHIAPSTICLLYTSS